MTGPRINGKVPGIAGDLNMTHSATEGKEFDFSGLSQLADEDPQAFERRRAELIEELIQSAPVAKQHRLRCLQWRIDQERRLCKTPMAACIKLSRMMWESVLGENGLLENLNHLKNGDFEPRLAMATDNILSFPPPTR